MQKVIKLIGLQLCLFFSLLAGWSSVQAADPYIGEVRWVGFNFAPGGWAECDGQLLPINQNQALFAILGTTYGGDGRTTFGLPDMRGRAMMHSGNGPGLSNRPLGQRSGAETHVLTTAEIASHSHALRADDSGGDNVKPDDRVISKSGRLQVFGTNAANTDMGSSSIAHATGGAEPHANMQPYVTANCIIALQGVFPSRN